MKLDIEYLIQLLLACVFPDLTLEYLPGSTDVFLKMLEILDLFLHPEDEYFLYFLLHVRHR